ncbi:MAG: hypothetical protein WD023_00620, partial [Ilumatobacteraceae bacterium]
MSWLGDRPDRDVLSISGGLAEQIEAMRLEAVSVTPGRTGELISRRAQQMITGVGSSADLGPLTAAEQVVVAITEQFLLDAHGIDDAMVAALGEHYTAAEQVAIMFHLALADGFTKFERIFTASPTTASPTTTSP